MKARRSRWKMLLVCCVLLAAAWGTVRLAVAWLQPEVITVLGTTKGNLQFPFKPGMTAEDAFKLCGFKRPLVDVQSITLHDRGPINRGKIWLRATAEKWLKGTWFDPKRSYPKWLAPVAPLTAKLHDKLIPGCEILFNFRWRPIMIAGPSANERKLREYRL